MYAHCLLHWLNECQLVCSSRVLLSTAQAADHVNSRRLKSGANLMVSSDPRLNQQRGPNTAPTLSTSLFASP